MVYNMMHNATGPWTGCNYADTAKYATGEAGQVFVSDEDKLILRGLAERVAKLAQDGSQKEKIQLYTGH